MKVRTPKRSIRLTTKRSPRPTTRENPLAKFNGCKLTDDITLAKRDAIVAQDTVCDREVKVKIRHDNVGCVGFGSQPLTPIK